LENVYIHQCKNYSNQRWLL